MFAGFFSGGGGSYVNFIMTKNIDKGFAKLYILTV